MMLSTDDKQQSLPYSPAIGDSDGDSLALESYTGRTAAQLHNNNALYGSLRKGGAVKGFSWRCAGLFAATFSSVFSYTALQNVTRPLMATQLEFSRPQQIAVQRLVELPMALSVLIGLLSDCYPILGLRRKPYLLIGLVLNAVGTIAIGIIAAHFESLDIDGHRNQALVVLLLLMVAIASFGCIMTYLAVQTRTIELSQQEPLGIRGAIQADYLIVRRIGAITASVFSFLVLGTSPSTTTRSSLGDNTANISLSNALFLSAIICVLPLPVILRSWYEEFYSLPVSIDVRGKIFWKIMQQKAVWRTLMFVAFFSMFLSVRFVDSANVVRAWAGAEKDHTFLLRMITEAINLLVIVVWRLVFMNRPWRSVFGLAPFFQVVPAMFISAFVAYNVTRDRYLYRAISSLTSVADGINFLTNIVPVTEIVQEGSEGVTVGLVLSLQRLIGIFVNTNAQGLFRGDNFYSPAQAKLDTRDSRTDVFLSLVLNYGINALAVVGLLFLPTQKLDAQQMRMYGGFTKIASSAIVVFAAVLFVYSMAINTMTFIPKTACARIVGGPGCGK